MSPRINGRLFVFMAALIAASTSVAAESLLTIDRIFHDREFELEEKVPSKWLEGGDSYTTVEPSESVDGGFDIVRHDSVTGARSILVEAGRLIPKGAQKPLGNALNDPMQRLRFPIL